MDSLPFVFFQPEQCWIIYNAVVLFVISTFRQLLQLHISSHNFLIGHYFFYQSTETVLLELLHLLEEKSGDEHWCSEFRVLTEFITKAVYQSLDKLLDVPDRTSVVSTKLFLCVCYI